MNLSPAQVSYVADLANVDLTPAENTRMVKDLNSILDFIDQLNEVDTANVAPMAQVMATGQGEQAGAYGYARRPDDPAATPSLPHEAVLQNSPVKDPNFFKVPKVIER
jgi:aspartyl-tRNA(Asn)/glutamyl-tRNA(Gln) amidotransferase subunit C